MDRKLNEVFRSNLGNREGEYQCLESTEELQCQECDMSRFCSYDEMLKYTVNKYLGECYSFKREDGKSVKFKDIKNVISEKSR